MRKRHLRQFSENWNPDQCNPDNWLPVRSSELPVTKRDKFLARKKALVLYLNTDTLLGEIVRTTGVSRSELYRITDRALSVRADGEPLGFLACLPGYRLKSYTLTSTSPKQRAGQMSQFLKRYPALHQQLDAWALGKKKLDLSAIRGRHTQRLWTAFRSACIEAGLDAVHDYPFTNADGGQEAVRRYVKSLREQYFVVNARVVHGNESGRLAVINGEKLPATTTIPYDRVQLDGHRIDAIFTVTLTDPQGNEQCLPLCRPWLLVLIDTASRAVLGYHLSLSENYTAEDVLTCLGSALEPWIEKPLPDSLVGYLPGAGLPSGVVEGCAWRVFNTLQMDNAFSHLSAWVQSRVLEAGAVEVVTNRPRSPRSDAIVERFMQTFEALSGHRLPNTTGSTPADPRRRKPEAAAVKLNLTMETLEIITDLTVANYNAMAHHALNGRSPLEYLRYRLERGGDLVRYAPNTTLDGLALFERDFSVTVRASAKLGHKPYVKFLGVRYTSATLRERFDLNGAKAHLRLNTRDIRTALLFVESGECVGSMEAEPRWLERAHSIAMRRAILALIKTKKLHTSSHSPVTDYLTYLASRASLSRKARNELLKSERSTTPSPASVAPTVQPRTVVAARAGRLTLTHTISR